MKPIKLSTPSQAVQGDAMAPSPAPMAAVAMTSPSTGEPRIPPGGAANSGDIEKDEKNKMNDVMHF